MSMVYTENVGFQSPQQEAAHQLRVLQSELKKETYCGFKLRHFFFHSNAYLAKQEKEVCGLQLCQKFQKKFQTRHR